MAKIIVELFCSTFYFLENTFYRVSFSEGFVPEVHSEFKQACLEPRSSINENFSVFDVVFLGKFR